MMSQDGSVNIENFYQWCDKYQSQVIVLATTICWSEDVEAALSTNKGKENLKPVLNKVSDMLKLLADLVLQEQPPLRRKKVEYLIYEYVHRRGITRNLIQIDGEVTNKSFEWVSQMRFYFDPKQSDVLQQLTINIADAQFY